MNRIGVDESGKGDYFGYLVVVACYVDDATEMKLRHLKVRDSKSLSDLQIRDIASKLRKLCRYEIVKFSPEKYNIRYPGFKSLNNMLAWAHAKSIEKLHEKVECDNVIVDKFADEKVLKKYLSIAKLPKSLKVEQRINAEQDLAVAAASIIARHEFLLTLRSLGRQLGLVLPKGSTHVQEAAKQIVEKYGEDMLTNVAKLHFKITKKVVNK